MPSREGNGRQHRHVSREGELLAVHSFGEDDVLRNAIATLTRADKCDGIRSIAETPKRSLEGGASRSECLLVQVNAGEIAVDRVGCRERARAARWEAEHLFGVLVESEDELLRGKEGDGVASINGRADGESREPEERGLNDVDEKIRGEELRERGGEPMCSSLQEGRRKALQEGILLVQVVAAGEKEGDFVVEPVGFRNFLGDSTFLLPSLLWGTIRE